MILLALTLSLCTLSLSAADDPALEAENAAKIAEILAIREIREQNAPEIHTILMKLATSSITPADAVREAGITVDSADGNCFANPSPAMQTFNICRTAWNILGEPTHLRGPERSLFFCDDFAGIDTEDAINAIYRLMTECISEVEDIAKTAYMTKLLSEATPDEAEPSKARLTLVRQYQDHLKHKPCFVSNKEFTEILRDLSIDDEDVEAFYESVLECEIKDPATPPLVVERIVRTKIIYKTTPHKYRRTS